MTAFLYDYQFELGDVVFGIGTPVTIEDEGFDPGTVTWRTQDAQLSSGDVTLFGVDMRTPPTWAWNLSTDCQDAQGALAAAAALEAVWPPDDVRLTPGAVMELRYAFAGRTRRVYGRPRKWAAPPSNRIIGGYMPITTDFVLADALHYDDVEESTQLGLVAAEAGGLEAPLASPLATDAYVGSRPGNLIVGGDVPTWPIITFHGPMSDPWVVVGEWRLDLNVDITTDETVVVDTRPWQRNVLRNGTSFIPGVLGRRTRLDQLSLPPGAHAVAFGGLDPSATGTVTVSWRPAYRSL